MRRLHDTNSSTNVTNVRSPRPPLPAPLRKPPSPPAPPPPTVCPSSETNVTILAEPSTAGRFVYNLTAVGTFVIFSQVGTDCQKGGMRVAFRTAARTSSTRKPLVKTLAWEGNGVGAGYPNQGFYVGDTLILVWNETVAMHGVAIAVLPGPPKSPPPSPKPPAPPTIPNCPANGTTTTLLAGPSLKLNYTYVTTTPGVYVLFNPFDGSCTLGRMHVMVTVSAAPRNYKPRSLALTWRYSPIPLNCKGLKACSQTYYQPMKLTVTDTLKFVWSNLTAGGVAIYKV